MEKKTLFLSIGIIVIIGIAGFGGGMYYAANNLEYEFVSIDKISMSFTSVLIEMTMKITNPTYFLVIIDGGSYDLYIDGNYVGAGEFGKLTLWKGSQNMTIQQRISNLPADLLAKIPGVLLGTQSLEIKIKMKSVVMFGMTVAVDYEKTMTFP